MMYIYLVERADQAGDDEQRAVVVVADGEDIARGLAAARCGDEGPALWRVSSTVVTLLGLPVPGLDAGVKCRDFNAGRK